MLTIQLFAQMPKGLYYTNEIYKGNVKGEIVDSLEIMSGTEIFLEIDDFGIRMYQPKRIGHYHGWKYVGSFNYYDTYILSNGSMMCIAPEITGMYYFYNDSVNYQEYDRIVEFRNLGIKNEKKKEIQ